MKTLIAASALVLTAGIASASTADFDRFGVDVDTLTAGERAAVTNAIHGPGSDSEIAALVNSLIKG
ncbi:hypothetical protein ACS3SW_15215 [Roseobacteraceae bacterium S113]